MLKEQIDSLLDRVQKPARYMGGEMNCVLKDPKSVDIRYAFAFPDVYEVGMSHLGSRILYDIINKREDALCERVFMPWVDMADLMRQEGVPLFSLETRSPIGGFDMLGVTLQYEMSYTNILEMLDLAGIPLRSEDRTWDHPIVIAGGPCAFNPEPLYAFIDAFSIGDGEISTLETIDVVKQCKQEGVSREECLRRLSRLHGVYVPSLSRASYNEDGTLASFEPTEEGVPRTVVKNMIANIDTAAYPENIIVPFMEIVHDRINIEVLRGCTRGCRFCQAGMIYRPVRERSKDKILQLAEKQLKNTGNDELSLLSLSTSDHSCFEALTMALIDYTKRENISLSLPSLRVDKFAFDVLNRIQEYKKSGLTYAPEAGTQRLRDVINKGVTESDIYQSIEQALELGWKHIKLYFMIGLPTETYEDLDGIVEIARNIRELNYKVNGPKDGRFSLTVSVSNFVPKAHTPFQWMAQDTPEMFAEKHNYLAERLKKLKGVTFHYHDNQTSAYEAVFARGDRRCSRLLYEAFRAGCRLDGWTEYFNREGWETAFAKSGINVDFYTTRQRSYDEILPWDIIDSGITKKFLKLESEKALAAQTTRDCRYGCVGCGMNQKVACPMEGIYGK